MPDAQVEIRVLGRFLVLRDGAEVPATAFGGRKVRQLVRVLASRRGAHVSHDALAEALWPQRLPADPAANLGVLVNRARRSLGDPALITTTPGGYALGAGCRVDADDFTERVAAARRAASGGDHAAATAGYQQAAAGWAGEPLSEDADAGWALGYRAPLLRLRQEALEEAALSALQLGESRLAIGFAAAAVTGDPLRESAHLALIRAHAAAGERAAALAAYQDLRRTLAGELGLDPSAEARALQRDLLGSAPAARGSASAHGAPARPPAPSTHEPGRLTFVGRERELATALAAVTGTGPGAVVLTGLPGSGKSRFLAELTDRAGMPVWSGRAVSPERSEAWSLVRGHLREALSGDVGVLDAVPQRCRGPLAAVLPELLELPQPGDQAAAGQRPAELDPQTRRALTVQGAVALLAAAAGGGVLLVVDDLQWADASSLALLGIALQRLPVLGCVVATRPLPAGAADPSVRFLADLTEHRPTVRIGLPPLAPDAVRRLAAPDLADALLRSTDASPFAVGEVLRALQDAGRASRDGHGSWRASAPDAVRLAEQLGAEGFRRGVRRSADRHPGTQRELLELLSLLGREAPAALLAAAAGIAPDAALEALVALATSGLVRLGDGGWAAAHDLVAETVAQGVPAAAGARLHAMLAHALAGRDGDAGELARHLQGAGDTDAAARAFEAAARGLLDAHAITEAHSMAEHGLALAPVPDLRRRLLDVRAGARDRTGDLAGARADLREAIAGSPAGPHRSPLLARLAMLYSGAEDLHRASQLCDLAVLEAGTDRRARAQALEVAAILAMNLEDPARAGEHAGAAQALYVELGDSAGTARVLDGRAMATFLGGGIAPAVTLFDRVATLFEDCGDLFRVVTPRSTRGHALVFGDRPAAGLADAEAALELSRQLGHPEGQAYGLWHRSEALSALGRVDEARDSAREALQIAQRLGHRGWTATALRALGIATVAAGEPDRAVELFHRSRSTAEGLSLFASWGSARLAGCLIATGRADLAVEPVARALAEGPPLARYEARLVAAELAAARGDDGTAHRAAEALDAAEAGGHLVSVPRLRQLAGGSAAGA